MLDVEDATAELEAPATESDDQKRYRRACAYGAAGAVVVFVAMLATSGANFLGESWTTHFYPAQAESLLRLRWNVPRDIVGFEGFANNGKWFMYYGPWPAALRAPVVLVSPWLADRMTQLSMTVAFGIALWSTARLSLKIRTMVRGNDPVTRLECWAAGGFVFVVGAGSVLLFLASQAWIYHEAEIWGAALALAAFDAIVGYLAKPSTRLLLLASVLAALALLSRASVGLGPVFALGLLAAAALFSPTRKLLGLPPIEKPWWTGAALGAAAAVPLALYAYTNYAKFGTLFVFPTGDQLMSQVNPQRKAFLADSGGSYFSMKFSATTLLQYFRPDAIRLSSLAPYVDFPRSAHVVGDVRFDAIEPTSSIPSSMPALTLLSVAGFVGLFFRRGTALARLRAPLVGAIVAAGAAIPFGYIAQRYLSDFMPVLVIAGLAGFHLVLRWSMRPESRRGLVRLTWIVLGTFAALSVVINAGLALNYHWLSPWLRESQTVPFVEAQRNLPQLPIGDQPPVERGAELPDRASGRGTMFVLGDCDAVYWSSGTVPSLAWSEWVGLQRTRAAGEYRLRVKFDKVKKVTRLPLVVRGEGGKAQTVAAFVSPRNRVRFGYHSQDTLGLPHGDAMANGWFVSRWKPFVPGQEYELTIVTDPQNGAVNVIRDGRYAFTLIRPELTPQQNQHLVLPTDVVAIGRNDVGAPTERRFLGSIEEVGTPRPELCNKLGAG